MKWRLPLSADTFMVGLSQVYLLLCKFTNQRWNQLLNEKKFSRLQCHVHMREKWDIYISLNLRYVKYVWSQNPNHIEISMQVCTFISLVPTWTRLMYYVNNKMYYPESIYGLIKASLSIWNHCAVTILRKDRFWHILKVNITSKKTPETSKRNTMSHSKCPLWRPD